MVRFREESAGPPAADRPGERPRSVSVLILARNEAQNLDVLLPAVRTVLDGARLAWELVVVDAGSPDGTAGVARRHGARVIRQRVPGYANALRQGIGECRQDFILTLDADMSHRLDFLDAMLDAGRSADLVIASRYVGAGSADMPAGRRMLSVTLNGVFRRLLGLPIKDLSSGFRLYRRASLRELAPEGDYFDVLPEIAALAHLRGHRVREIPFHYHPREAGVSKARILRFAPSYVRTLLRCRRARRRAR
jgi:dolichol-phosphate mannosyltransferase